MLSGPLGSEPCRSRMRIVPHAGGIHNACEYSCDTLFIMQYIGIAFCLFALVFVSQARLIVETVPQLGAVIASVVIEITNTERGAVAGPLRVSSVLTEAAEAKARHMAEEGYFAHIGPDGKTPWQWFSEAGYTFAYAGENLAVRFDESADVVTAWMNSPSHRANIVGTQFTEIGVGVAEGVYEGRPATFVVQMFGTPRPAPSETPITESALLEPKSTALATTLPGEPPRDGEVLGEAELYLETHTVPWWYSLIHRFL